MKHPLKPIRPAASHSPPIAPARFTDLGQLPVTVRLGSYTAQALNWGFIEPRWWRNFLHTHSFFEICYAYAGRGTFQMLGKTYQVKAGDVFVAKPGEPHEIISDRRQPLGIYFWSYTLIRGKLADSSPIDALLEAFGRSTRWISRDAPGMKRTLELLTEEAVKRSAGFPLVIDGLVAKLLLDTARAVVDEPMRSEQVEPPAATETEAAVRTACRYIRDNLARSIGVRDIAAQVHFSERHLGRLFHQARGMSIMDYVTNARMEAAGQLLLDQQSPVKKVAAAVGYPDVHYFTTLFRKRNGVTPGAFRKGRGTTFVKRVAGC
jgi:AraC family L-rhamnose operon transcriptional activator RhaR